MARGILSSVGEDDVQALVLSAVYLMVEGQSDRAEELFAIASMKKADVVKAAKASLGLVNGAQQASKK